MRKRLVSLPLLALLSAFSSAPLAAAPQPPPTALADAGSSQSTEEIVVVGMRLPTPADTAIPEKSYDREAVRSFGASSVGEVVGQVSAQSRNGLGEDPIVLLNGRRISGFGEISGLPPETVRSVDVLPEKVALSYGYGPGRRVMNVVLFDRFRASTVDTWASAPTEGGRGSARVGASSLSIRGSTRWSVDGSYQADTHLLEGNRRIASDPLESPFDLRGNIEGFAAGEIDPALSRLVGHMVAIAGVPASAAARPPTLSDFAAAADRPNSTDQSRDRTLLPEVRRAALNGTVSGFVLGTLSGTLNLRAERASADELLGLPGVALLLPPSNPFSPFQVPVRLLRASDARGPVDRHVTSTILRAGGILNGAVGRWQWSLTTNVDRTKTVSRTDGLLDAAGVQARVNANDPSFNPFAPLPASAFPEPQTARWSTTAAGAELVAYGKIASLPAGPMTGSVTIAEQHSSLAASTAGFGAGPPSGLTRDRQSVQVAADIPVLPSRRGTGGLSANASLAVTHLSDFGTIRRISTGLDWRPARSIGMTATVLDEGRAPTMQQLGEASVVTPNFRIFDLARQQTVEVARIDGGNRLLRRSARRQAGVGLLLKPAKKEDLSLRVDLTRVRERNPVFAFPAFTSELELSLPQRFERDASGQLVGIDARPFNLVRAKQTVLRWGVNWSHNYAPHPKGAVTRLDLSLFHTWTLRDRAIVKAGAPILDFLDGSSAGILGGRPRHQLELQAGAYRKGLGLRLNAAYRGASAVRNTDITRAKELFFRSYATADLRLFWDLGQSRKLVQRLPWARNLRVSIAVTNLADARPHVRLADGTTPFAYQGAFLEPLGRNVAISVRKLF